MKKLYVFLKKQFLGTISRTNLIINEFKLNQSFIYVWGMKPSGLRFRKKK